MHAASGLFAAVAARAISSLYNLLGIGGEDGVEIDDSDGGLVQKTAAK